MWKRTSGRLKAQKEYEENPVVCCKGKLDLRAIEENKEALLKMDSIVATQAIRVEKAKENVEAARERMAEAMKERKMHETLREKAFEAFLQEENHAESKAIDELTSYTYGQKNR
ncbi:MAG: flagellar export protein FliJ [Waltera sp.]